MDQIELGKFIQTRRKRFHFTQEELGIKIGYSAQAISKFEEGCASISCFVLPILAEALNFKLDEIVIKRKDVMETSLATVTLPLLTKQLKLIRLYNKISQNIFSSTLGISPRTIRNYERGISIPPISFLLDLYKNFKILPSQIMYENIELVEFENRKNKKKSKQ